MGNIWSYRICPDQILDNVKQFVTGQKRKREESDSEEEMNKVIDIAMHTPKR